VASKFIKLDAKKKAVVFGGSHLIEDEFLYECFRAKGPDGYDEAFKEFLTVGAYAWQEDRLYAFFRKVEDEVEGRLEELKVLYKVRQLNEVTTQKGAVAEREAKQALDEFVVGRGWPDRVTDLSTAEGEIAGRKVGDLMVEIGDTKKKVVIEAKIDKSVPLGDPTTTDNRRNKSVKSEKSAYGQNLTSLANRNADVAIIFFDTSATSSQIAEVEKEHNGILFVPELPGFVVVVDKARDDWTNLLVAYSLARWIALLGKAITNPRRVELALKRLIRDVARLASLEATREKARKSAQQTVDTLDEMSRLVADVSSSAQASLEFLQVALNGKKLTDSDWKKFYDEDAAR
jgi:hypothetical protein